MDKDTQARLYRELMGAEAAARQEALSKDTCPSCGYKKGYHHPACKTGRRLASK